MGVNKVAATNTPSKLCRRGIFIVIKLIRFDQTLVVAKVVPCRATNVTVPIVPSIDYRLFDFAIRAWALLRRKNALHEKADTVVTVSSAVPPTNLLAYWQSGMLTT